MTVYKKHMTPNGESGICNAKVKCPYGGESNHFYYDSSIRQKVLSPDSPMQKVIDRVPSEELLDKAPELLAPGSDLSSEYNNYHTALAMRTDAYNEQKEAIIKSYPIKHQSAVRQLTGMHEGAGMIASFEIFDPEEEDFTVKSDATEDEKLKFAQAYLNKFKAETKLRAILSASNL
jgi:hypothetical protein